MKKFQLRICFKNSKHNKKIKNFDAIFDPIFVIILFTYLFNFFKDTLSNKNYKKIFRTILVTPLKFYVTLK